VVYQPKNMSAKRLQELLDYAWDSFYREEAQSLKMARLFQKVIKKEMADGSFKPRRQRG